MGKVQREPVCSCMCDACVLLSSGELNTGPVPRCRWAQPGLRDAPSTASGQQRTTGLLRGVFVLSFMARVQAAADLPALSTLNIAAHRFLTS